MRHESLARGARVEEDHAVVTDELGGGGGDRLLSRQLQQCARRPLARGLDACPLSEAHPALHGDHPSVRLQGGDVTSHSHVRDTEVVGQMTNTESTRSTQQAQELALALFGDEGRIAGHGARV